MSREARIRYRVGSLILLAGAYPLFGLFADNAGPDPGRSWCIGGRCCCVGKQPLRGASDDAETLNPEQFVGSVKHAYEFAGRNPALLSQLWCYCGCDRTDGHRSLLDCYRDTHGHGARFAPAKRCSRGKCRNRNRRSIRFATQFARATAPEKGFSSQLSVAAVPADARRTNLRANAR